MFDINKSSFDEVLENLEINLNKNALDTSTIKEKKLVNAVELLNSSAGMLEQFGFEKEAESLTRLMILASDYSLTHEGPDEYKREKLEEEYLEEILENDYDKILKNLDEDSEMDEVII